jgi:hypothetical protein
LTRRLRTATSILSGLAAVALTGSTALAAASPAQDPVQIGPGQYFTATINGVSTDPMIQVACPGPVTPGETGHPVSGQYLEVQLASGSTTTGVGYTGSAAKGIDVLFNATSSTSAIVLTAYYAPVAIPTALNLPCYGTGSVVFAPAPSSSTAKNLTLTVTYQNIAV